MSAALLLPYLPALIVIAVAGIVAVLYWLKPPPRTVIVPSSLIWDRVLREIQPRVDRLRWWLSLLLAILIATVIVSALVPLLDTNPGATHAKFILVLDNSPSMAARTTDGATRWDHALARARALIEAQSAGTRIWLADSMRRIDAPAFQDRQAALAQLASLRVSHGAVPGLVLPEQPAGIEMVVITDAVSIGPLPAQARLESVFESVENAGITAFEVRALPADPRRYLAYVELVNASAVDKRIELAISGIGGKRLVRVVPISANGIRRQMIDISDFDSGPLRASIAVPGDALAIDDVAYAIVPVRRLLRVALVTGGSAFLEQSLRVQPRVETTLIAPARYVDDRGYDAVVFDRYAPRARPLVPALLFRPSRAQWLPAQQQELARLSATAWSAAHPLLDNISLLDLNVDRATLYAWNAHTQAAGSVLASGRGRVPLIMIHEDGARWILVAFGLDDSNFALHAGFPMFLNNALKWMIDEHALTRRGLGSIEVPVSGARVLAIDGTEVPSQATAGGSVFEAGQPGFFTVVSAHQRLRVAANLFDRRITEVNQSPLAQIKPGALTPIGAQPAFAFDVWFALLIAAALLLLLEWWSWNRRVTL